MDDQSTYLLNGLLTRQFNPGRVVRFREVTRGRQARCLELFTAQEREFLLYLFPPAYSADRLAAMAERVNRLDQERFSVVPFLRMKGGADVDTGFVGEGPQGSRMMLSVAPAGSALSPFAYTDHDLSQVGLRLGWAHRLLNDQFKDKPAERSIVDRFHDLFFERDGKGNRAVPTGDDPMQRLLGLISLPVPQGWTHGDVHAAALLHDGDHQLRTVVDWGLLHWGCPLTDLVDAFALFTVNREGVLDLARGRALMESYDTLIPLKGTAWTPVVAWWCARRIVEIKDGLRRPEEMEEMSPIVREPERLATALASCTA